MAVRGPVEMRLLMSLLALFCLARASAGAAPAQSFYVRIDAAGAHAKSIAHYVSGAPISITVTSESGTFDAISVIARGPGSTKAHTMLARSTSGAFTGAIALETPGAWKITLETQAGEIQATTSPITLDVVTEAADPSPWFLLLGAALFALVGAGGFVRLRHSAKGAGAAKTPRAAT
ncbi:MAG: hypothetical protein NVSMB5_05580 [Candidatus Velthaea sp.]